MTSKDSTTTRPERDEGERGWRGGGGGELEKKKREKCISPMYNLLPCLPAARQYTTTTGKSTHISGNWKQQQQQQSFVQANYTSGHLGLSARARDKLQWRLMAALLREITQQCVCVSSKHQLWATQSVKIIRFLQQHLVMYLSGTARALQRVSSQTAVHCRWQEKEREFACLPAWLCVLKFPFN